MFTWLKFTIILFDIKIVSVFIWKLEMAWRKMTSYFGITNLSTLDSFKNLLNDAKFLTTTETSHDREENNDFP